MFLALLLEAVAEVEIWEPTPKGLICDPRRTRHLSPFSRNQAAGKEIHTEAAFVCVSPLDRAKSKESVTLQLSHDLIVLLSNLKVWVRLQYIPAVS